MTMYIMDVVKRLNDNKAYKQKVGVDGVVDVLVKTLPMNYVTAHPSISREDGLLVSYIDYSDEATFFMHEGNVVGKSIVRPEYVVHINMTTLELTFEMSPSPIVLGANAPTNQEDADKLFRKYKHFEEAIDPYVEMIDNYTEYNRVLSLNEDYRGELTLINNLLRGKDNGEFIIK